MSQYSDWEQAKRALLSDSPKDSLDDLHFRGNGYASLELTRLLPSTPGPMAMEHRLIRLGQLWEAAAHYREFPFALRVQYLGNARRAFEDLARVTTHAEMAAKASNYLAFNTFALDLLMARENSGVVFTPRLYDPTTDTPMEYMARMRLELHEGSGRAGLMLAGYAIRSSRLEAARVCELAASVMYETSYDVENFTRARLIAASVWWYGEAPDSRGLQRAIESLNSLSDRQRYKAVLFFAEQAMNGRRPERAVEVLYSQTGLYGAEEAAIMAATIHSQTSKLDAAESMLNDVIGARRNGAPYSGPTSSTAVLSSAYEKLVAVLLLQGPARKADLLSLLAERSTRGVSAEGLRLVGARLIEYGEAELALEQFRMAAKSNEFDDVIAYVQCLSKCFRKVEAYRELCRLIDAGHSEYQPMAISALAEIGGSFERRRSHMDDYAAHLVREGKPEQGQLVAGMRLGPSEPKQEALIIEASMPSIDAATVDQLRHLLDKWAQAGEWSTVRGIVGRLTEGTSCVSVEELGDGWVALVSAVDRMKLTGDYGEAMALSSDLVDRGLFVQGTALLHAAVSTSTNPDFCHDARLHLASLYMARKWNYEAIETLTQAVVHESSPQAADRFAMLTQAYEQAGSLVLASEAAMQSVEAGGMPPSALIRLALRLDRLELLPAACAIAARARPDDWSSPWFKMIDDLVASKNLAEARTLFAWAVSQAADEGFGQEVVRTLVRHMVDAPSIQLSTPTDLVAEALAEAADVGGWTLKIMEAVRRSDVGQNHVAAVAFHDALSIASFEGAELDPDFVAEAVDHLMSRFTASGDIRLVALVAHDGARALKSGAMWMHAADAWARLGESAWRQRADSERLMARIGMEHASEVRLPYPRPPMPDEGPGDGGAVRLPLPPKPTSPLTGSTPPRTPDESLWTESRPEDVRGPDWGDDTGLNVADEVAIMRTLQIANAVILEALIAAGDGREIAQGTLRFVQGEIENVPQLLRELDPDNARDALGAAVRMFDETQLLVASAEESAEPMDYGILNKVGVRAQLDLQLQAALHLHEEARQHIENVTEQNVPCRADTFDLLSGHVMLDRQGIAAAEAIVNGAQAELIERRNNQLVEARRRASTTVELLGEIVSRGDMRHVTYALLRELPDIPQVAPLREAIESARCGKPAFASPDVQPVSIVESAREIVGGTSSTQLGSTRAGEQAQHQLDIARLRLACGNWEGAETVAGTVINVVPQLSTNDFEQPDRSLAIALHVARETTGRGAELVDGIVGLARERALTAGAGTPDPDPARHLQGASESPSAEAYLDSNPCAQEPVDRSRDRLVPPELDGRNTELGPN